MNENEFFRQATLRICGHLEIEHAMASLVQYLQDKIPADMLCLELYDENFTSMTTIAIATPLGGNKYDVLTPISKQAKAFVRNLQDPNTPDVIIFNHPETNPLTREMCSCFGVSPKTIMVMHFVSRGLLVGAALLSLGEQEHTPDHSRLLSLLKEPFAIALSNAIEHRKVVKLMDVLADDNKYLHGELRRLTGDEIVGADFGLKEVMTKVRQVASLESPVLLLGETGVGKDVIANAIHFLSHRKDALFVKVNCGAIPESLIDSELFGYEKGAFTGALNQKRGRFERADKGTIFLDEIGELPLQSQVRLLSVLQDKEIERVGGNRTIQLDIRIIAASNRNLEQMVESNQFREDLWFRLNVFPIWIPPLRQRKSDIPSLLQHIIIKKTKELKLPVIPTIEPSAIDILMAYNWPGNVRELQNIVEREMILNPNGPLTFAQVQFELEYKDSAFSQQVNHDDSLDAAMSHHIRRILAKTNGRITGKGGAAELLGMNPSTLRNRMKKLKIVYKRKISQRI